MLFVNLFVHTREFDHSNQVGLEPVIMDIIIPTTTNKARVLIFMVQYYWGIWSNSLHVLAPLIDLASYINGRIVLCNKI